MLALQIPLLLLALSASSLGPGLWVVRRWPLRPLERLCVSVGTSLLGVAVWAALVYGVRIDWQASSILLFCLSAGALLAAGRDVATLCHDRRVRQALVGFGLLLLIGFVILGLVRHAS